MELETPGIQSLPEIVGALLEARPQRSRFRILFDAVHRSELGSALALWRLSQGRWMPLLERGPEDALPPSSLIQAVLAGEVAMELPGRTSLLKTDEVDGDQVALILGEVSCSRETLNLVDGLLTMAGLMEREAEPLAEIFEPPLSSARPSDLPLRWTPSLGQEPHIDQPPPA